VYVELVKLLLRSPAEIAPTHDAARVRLPPDEDVLFDREVRHQIELLVDNRNPEALGVAWITDRHRDAVDQNLSLIRRVDPGQDFHQCALAGAVLADQPEHLAGVDMQAHILERDDSRKGLRHSFHPKERRRR
jgi:hypothetical protein